MGRRKKRQNGPSARFWIYENGDWVKLTLRPGQTLEHYSGGPTDEGWSRTWTSFTHDGLAVLKETETNARDCDGRIDYHSLLRCPLHQLAARFYFGHPVPEWQKITASQRDHEAERAGY